MAGVEEVHILWTSELLGCDGDSVSVTAATLPSVEDVVLGNIPGLPKVHLHNKVLAYENGDEFMRAFYRAEQGELDPFVFVVEGSIPNESIKREGYWAAMGTDPATGQPIPTTQWIDRLAPKAWAVVAAGTCATYGGIHAMQGNPTGAMGLADYLGWNFRSKAGIPIVNVPGCPVQPDNFMETRLDGRHRRLPQRRRHLHRLHHARLPRQVHALYGRAARQQGLYGHNRSRVRPLHTQAAQHHQPHGEPGTQVAPQGPPTHDRLPPAVVEEEGRHGHTRRTSGAR